MPTILPPALSPQLPEAWDTPENKTIPCSAEMDRLLLRTIQKPAWAHASDAPMTLDPVTHKPMVDPVLCSDGKLHDRTSTRPLPYLDRDATGARNLQVLGHDQEARGAVHTAFPVARAMLALRTSVAQRITDARPAPAPAPPTATDAPSASPTLSVLEAYYRQYQLRRRGGELRFTPTEGLTRTRNRPRPLSFSRNTFTRFHVFPEVTGWRSVLKHVVATPSQRLVDHLASHGVFQGHRKSDRLLGNMENLEGALDTFKIGERHLTDAEKVGVNKYLKFFERHSRAAWETCAQLEHTYDLLAQNEFFFHTPASNQMPVSERQALERHHQYLCLQLHELYQTLRTNQPRSADTGHAAFSPISLNVPAPKRTQSLQNLRLTDDLEALDPDLFYCPLMLETAPAPVLCSDGHTYDLSQVLESNLTVSPLTREPMHMIGRHEEKQLWAAHLVSKQGADFFKQTYDGLSKAYGPKGDAFDDRLVSYQRRRRALSRATRPDSVSLHVFKQFIGLSTLESEYVVASLAGHGIINRALNRSIAPDASEAAMRQAVTLTAQYVPRLTAAHQNHLVHILSVLLQEQKRRHPLVAKARHLSAQLPRLPKGTPRHAEIATQLAEVDRELHKLPSGRLSTDTLRLY